jgi:aspartate racemase
MPDHLPHLHEHSPGGLPVLDHEMGKAARTWGVLGGMGPLASAAFVLGVYEAAASLAPTEQAMPRILLGSDPSLEDRSEVLRGSRTARSALTREIERRARHLLRLGVTDLVVCCFTAHRFIELGALAGLATGHSLVDAMAAAVARSGRRTLLLSMSGAADWLAAHSPMLERLDPAEQAALDLILHSLKLGRPPLETVGALNDLVERHGTDQVAFGCTELHLLTRAAGGSLPWQAVDPLDEFRWLIAGSNDDRELMI